MAPITAKDQSHRRGYVYLQAVESIKPLHQLIMCTREHWLHRESYPPRIAVVFITVKCWHLCPKSPTGYNRCHKKSADRDRQRSHTGSICRRIKFKTPKLEPPANQTFLAPKSDKATTDLFCRLNRHRSRVRAAQNISLILARLNKSILARDH